MSEINAVAKLEATCENAPKLGSSLRWLAFACLIAVSLNNILSSVYEGSPYFA
jgi:hypothetical protein